MMWKTIDKKPRYSVSSLGDIRNDKTGRILKQHKGTSGYYQIMLGRKTTPLYVHRIVAAAFLENPQNLPQVDHINGNKLDNRVENLRWVTVSENCKSFGCEARRESRKKKVLAFKGNEKILFNSRYEAAEYFGSSSSQIKYNRRYKKGGKKDWVFVLAKDIV